jgi:putative intracellular protease/amidase
MYQYAFNDPNFDGIPNNFYQNSFYNGDANLNDGVIAPQKVAVNNLINEFLDDNKPVAGVCHGVTVLAWARVDGVSPLAGKRVAVPLVQGTPAMTYNGTFFSAGFPMGQFIQARDVGAYAFNVSGQYGNPTTVADDVVVDGRIITAQDNNAAFAFGQAIAATVIADANLGTPMAPTVDSATAPQRSRVTSLSVIFDSPVNAAMLAKPGAITLSNGSTILQTGNFAAGRINVSPASGTTNTLTLTFSNNLRNVLENGSLSDGIWRLSIPDAGYEGTIRRLFGDADGNGTVDATDYAAFGGEFGQNVVNSQFDYDANGTIDSNDLSFFGSRFGRTL